MKNDIQALRTAIQDLHGCKAVHLRSEAVTETFQGQLVWAGTVEVFSVLVCDDVELCYAWQYEKDGKPEYVAVLGKPPIDSSQKAVQAFIVSRAKK